MDYEGLLTEADDNNLIVKEKLLTNNDGLIKDNRIAIRRSIKTSKKKSCVLAEELGHYFTTVGNIADQSDAGNRKQEQKARLWGYNKMIGLMGIVDAYQAGCQSTYETAEYLNVTEEFLLDALERYKSKFGKMAVVDNYVIYFEPYIAVLEAHC